MFLKLKSFYNCLNSFNFLYNLTKKLYVFYLLIMFVFKKFFDIMYLKTQTLILQLIETIKVIFLKQI